LPLVKGQGERKPAFSVDAIDPFSDAQVRKTEKRSSIISYGLSSCGYDLRVSKASAHHFQDFSLVRGATDDPGVPLRSRRS
jgi:hypothetical protein